METYNKIEKYTHEKSKQGYEGYQDTIEYFSKFSENELDYIEVKAKLSIESSKRLYEYKGVVTLFISMLGLFFAILPDDLANNPVAFQSATVLFLLAMVVYYSIYYIIDKFSCSAMDKSQRVLLIVEKVRKI